MKWGKKIEDSYFKEVRVSEDKYVLRFLSKYKQSSSIDFLDVGAGMGRFANIISAKENYKLTCVEINEDNAKQIASRGIDVKVENILNNTIESRKYDIVHCSHVIEHFKYPEVTLLLDELCRVAKDGGLIIIRTPLPSAKFYFDIDHIRPYPAQAILSYYNNPQQQKVGKYNVEFVGIKLRRQAYLPFPYSLSSIGIFFNRLCMFLWTMCRFPISSPNGYTLILKKNGTKQL